MRKAFTLLELLVAIAITSIIIVFASQVLSHVSDAASIGFATSHVIQNSRMTPEVLAYDFEQMLSPKEGGFIVIIQRKVNALAMEGESAPTDFRSDQIVFVKKRAHGEYPMMPASAIDYDGGVTKAQFIRVWYGHVVRTDDVGFSPTGADLGMGADEFAVDWILGRHALFLDADYGTDYPANQRVNSAAHDTAMTTNYNNTTPRNLPRRLWMGLADIAEIGLHEPSSADPANFGPLVNHATVAAWKDTLAQDMNPTDYAAVAMRHAFTTERLRVGLKPKADYNGDGNYDDDSYQSWQIAQMIPNLMGSVTEFKIQFCGDYDGDGKLDTDPNSAMPGQPTTAGTMWYDIDNPPPNGFTTGGQGPIGLANPAEPHADSAFIFRHSDNAEEANWPLMIRVQYRLSDPGGHIVDRDGSVGRLFEQVFRVKRE